MAEHVGKITEIKVGSFFTGGPDPIDMGAITLKETSTGLAFVLHLWVSHSNEPALQRVLQSQRLALVREAAFRNLTVRVTTPSTTSDLIETIQVFL